MVRSLHPPPPSPPAPSPDQESNIPLIFQKTPRGQLMRIELYVLLTVAFMVTLLFLGRKRRFVRAGYFTKFVTRVIYTLTPAAIAYMMGMMHNASTIHMLYPVWACALVYAYGGVVTMSACRFGDNEDTLSYLLRTLPLLFWTTWLAVLALYNERQRPALVSLGVVLPGFLLVSVLNMWETMQAFYLASKRKGLPGFVEPIVSHMSAFSGGDDEHDPMPEHVGAAVEDTMEGYSFLVRSREGEENTTTVDVWNLFGNQGPLEGQIDAHEENLKDLCLSYAFFGLILRRFADCPLDELSQPTKIRRFMRQRLNLDRTGLRIFGVIEVELHFLFDFFYTKSYGHSSHEWIHACKAPGLAGLLLFAGIVGLSPLPPVADRRADQTESFSISFRGHNVDVGVTRVVILIFASLEILKLIRLQFSNRKMVHRLCTFRQSKLPAWVKKMLINLIWDIKEYLHSTTFVSLFKPWQRKLGQYSFLESHGKVPVLARERFPKLIPKIVKLPRVGQTGNFNVPLLVQVKTVITTSLLRHLQVDHVPLTPGTATIERFGLSVDVKNACRLLDVDSRAGVNHLENTHAHLILVWHIATRFCEAHYRPTINTDGDDAYEKFLVATHLSNYCAYLLTFAPKLLPDLPYTTQRVIDVAHQQLAGLERNGEGLVMGLEELRTKLLNPPAGNGVDVNATPKIILKGATLASSLLTQIVSQGQQCSNMWRFLAEFWAELILYLAPSDNVTAHGEYLARGGEFITHLWALLTHSGILARDRNPSVVVVEERPHAPESNGTANGGIQWEAAVVDRAGPGGLLRTQPDQSTNLESRFTRRGTW